VPLADAFDQAARAKYDVVNAAPPSQTN
jgi:hypothetical protein